MLDFTFQQLLARMFGALMGVAVSCWTLAKVIDGFGDPGPKYDGRLTLNPFTHLDIVGGAFILMFSFGWAKPLVVEPERFARPRLALVAAGLSGSVSLLVLAGAVSLLAPLSVRHLPDTAMLASLSVVNTVARMTTWLALFSLIPLPPLPGYLVLSAAAPSRLLEWGRRYVLVGQIGLAVLILTGVATRILAPMHRVMMAILGTGG